MLEKASEWLKKALHHLDIEFSKLQLGRANPSLVEGILVEQYGAIGPIKNCASVNVLDNQTLSIQPWDRSLVHALAKAITESGLWLNPQSMADSVMIRIPALTEERRKDAAKIAKKMAEDAKVWVRNVRQDILKEIKKGEDDGELSEDDVASYEKDLQKMVDDTNKQIDEMTKKKEADIMKV